MSTAERVKAKIAEVRARSPFVDHVLRMQEHYGGVKGGQQAAGVTYFGFLSVFPILALAFFAVGYVARIFPDAEDSLVKAIDGVLPGIVGDGENQIALADVQSAAGAVGLIGLAGVLYAGLGWLSSLQTALIVVFEMPDRLRPSFVIGKLRDLLSLIVLGAVLLVSVGASGVLTRMSRQVLDWLHLGGGLGWVVTLIALGFGLATSALLFFLMFRILARPPTPARALWSGAWLGAVGFELLKQLSSLLLSSTRGQPAFQAFGIALILLVWINYFSQVILYAAAWAHTSPLAERPPVPVPAAAAIAAANPAPVTDVREGGADPPPRARVPGLLAFSFGSIAGALVATVRRRR